MVHTKELTERVRANEKVVAAIGLFGSVAVAFIGAGYFAPKAEACSPRLDGEPTFCPPPDYIPPKPKPLIPKEELRGEIDIYEPTHWYQMQMMFIRNERRKRIEENMTLPSD